MLVVSAVISSSRLISRFRGGAFNWKFSVIIGVFGGLFGIYGNISGVDWNGALVSVRDIGPMMAGFVSGPLGGVIAGAIAGAHRLLFGGDTMYACMIATTLIGLICGLLMMKFRNVLRKPYWALLIGALMEIFHLGMILLIVRPFGKALNIVAHIALPFIVVNSVGFMLMILIITYIEKQRAMALEQSRLHSDLEVASRIQHSLLPDIGGAYPGRPEIDMNAFMCPAKEVGGDFYDTFFVDPSHLAIVIGDVSGKGIPGALFMASAKTVLQNCIKDIPALSEAMTVANNVLCSRNDADMFVTVWAGIVDLSDGSVRYVSAGHNPPVLENAGGTDYVRTKNGFVMAGMEGIKYRENELRLSPGDMLLLYTDGIVEAETAKHELYGEERLTDCLRSVAGASTKDVIESVRSSVDGFAGGNDQFDDMTMLCLRYLGAG